MVAIKRDPTVFSRVDNKMTAMMVEDMIHDPILAAKVILGMRVPPHQEIRMAVMWCTHYTQDDSGFSTGKSTTLAMICALRSVLFPNRSSGIISGTFRQGKLIFINFDKWAAQSAIFRSCIRKERGHLRLIHGSEAWEAYFRGGSVARALPPDFTRHSKRLQSERWHDAYLDEWTTFDMGALTKTILGRVTAINMDSEDPIRQNHIHLCSVAGFEHDPAYALVRKIQNNVASGDKDYCQFTCNYRHVPRTKEWKGFVDHRTIFDMQTLNPPGVVKGEVDGLWQKDSMSFYSSTAIERSRWPQIRIVLRRSLDDDVFVGGFDTARGGSEMGKGDDFAITLLRIPPMEAPPQQVYTVRRNFVTSEQMASIVHDTHSRFGMTYCCYDPGGGGLFVKDDLKKTSLIINGEMQYVTPILDYDNHSGEIGHNILIPFKRGSMFIDLAFGKFASESVLINLIHKRVSGALSAGRLFLGPKWDGWDGIGSSWDADAKRTYLDTHSGLPELERLRAEIDLCSTQLTAVDVARDRSTNQPILDKYGMYKFMSKAKKDSAYSLIYAYFMYLVYLHLKKIGFVRDANDEEGTIAVGGLLFR
jgi:hypothetical protein